MLIINDNNTCSCGAYMQSDSYCANGHPKETTKSNVIYHVFTDGYDDWFESYDGAKEAFDKMCESNDCARLYEEEQDEDGETISEDCILSFGRFPS